MKQIFRTSLAGMVCLAVLGAGATSVAASAPTKADEAFARLMPMHHSMAVSMAQMAVEEAEHKPIRTTARNIIKSQRREIEKLMKLADRLGIEPSATHGHTQMMEDLEALGLTMAESGMRMTMDGLDDADPFDRAFIDLMIPHHQGAIRMARAELKRGKVAELRAIARAVVKAQTMEIRAMNGWRAAWYGKPSPAGGVPKG